MPLNNDPRLAKIVNTTEKLVQRMDAYGARRIDAEDTLWERAKRLKGAEGAEAFEKLSLHQQRNFEREFGKRKDDYGHPVKLDNRVQQTDYGKSDPDEDSPPRRA